MIHDDATYDAAMEWANAIAPPPVPCPRPRPYLMGVENPRKAAWFQAVVERMEDRYADALRSKDPETRARARRDMAQEWDHLEPFQG